MKHRVVFTYQDQDEGRFGLGAIVLTTSKTDPVPESESWLAEVKKIAEEQMNSSDVFILSWQLMAEEPGL
jgi:hypothetical protein